MEKPEVVIGDILTTVADAVILLPGVSLGGVDLSVQVMQRAGLAEMPACEEGKAVMVPGGGLGADWLILGKAVPLGDGKNKELALLIRAMGACIELARSRGCETVAFASFPAAQYNARLFSVLTAIWRAIMDAQRAGTPKRSRIVCANAAIAKQYCAAYNYWYAAGKEDRLEGG